MYNVLCTIYYVLCTKFEVKALYTIVYYDTTAETRATPAAHSNNNAIIRPSHNLIDSFKERL
jgi:hypothetical protein